MVLAEQQDLLLKALQEQEGISWDLASVLGLFRCVRARKVNT